ncbi:M20/M25/M40 family metallo-hydrolase [Streptomyces chartreusis]|uniref:M20/M25/M40 family metallo-hydrolase n=1 Tax=Streptomyces chartreusis TaxID=1969 RepID=UPI003D94DF09
MSPHSSSIAAVPDPSTADPGGLLARLIAIDSVNPDLVAGGAGEAAVADFCGTWLAARGFEIHRLERRPGRPSVVAVARGTGGGRSLMFNGHLDTAGLAGYDGDPLAPRVSDGGMYGRGTFDTEQALGHPPVVRAEPFWTDCALLDRAGIPCLLFGADGEGAHAATEYVDLASLDRLTDVLTATITDFCS